MNGVITDVILHCCYFAIIQTPVIQEGHCFGRVKLYVSQSIDIHSQLHVNAIETGICVSRFSVLAILQDYLYSCEENVLYYKNMQLRRSMV